MQDAARWWRGRVARAAYPVAGAVFGLVVSLASPHRGTQPWVVWACLAIALAATSGAVFGYGLARWPEIAGLGPIRIGRVAAFVVQVAAVGVALMVLGEIVTLNQDVDPGAVGDRGRSGLMLTLLAGLAAIPVGAGFAAVREQARALHGPPGEQVEEILVLSRMLAGLLGAFGALVGLATLALGAALRQGTRPDSAVVVIFGAAWSVVVACAYAPAAGALRSGARELCRTVVPLADASAAELPGRAEDRRRLEQALGVDRGFLADIQSGLIIFAPLLASATAVFLPG
jgi:hypothetical protein